MRKVPSKASPSWFPPLLGLVTLFCPAPGPCGGKGENLKDLIPDLVVCGRDPGTLAHVRKGRSDWEYPMAGPLLDIQREPQAGTFLVTGGEGKVSLVRKIWRGYKVLWDWKEMAGADIRSAVAADWDTKNNPTLVLAADAAPPRLFLADARARDPKVRWQYKLPVVPRRVHLCTDNGNFLVVLADSTVEEIHFQEDKVVLTLGKAEGLQDPLDAVRDPWANTYVADAGSGDVICFDPQDRKRWRTHLPFAPARPEEMALSLFRKAGKRLLLVSVHFKGGDPASRDVVYILHTSTGGVLAWKDRAEKGGLPSFTKAAPDQAEYLKKQ